MYFLSISILEARLTLREIQSAPLLAEVPFPSPPSLSMAKQGRVAEYIAAVQNYMITLTYNHTGTQFFETRPNSSMITLMETARSIVREAIPIKCKLSNGFNIWKNTIFFFLNIYPWYFWYKYLNILGMEAVVLSIYLTNGVPCLGRFPINFKSELPPGRVGPKGNQRYFYHIVLGLAHGSRFGSVGLSRRYTYFQTCVLIPIYVIFPYK